MVELHKANRGLSVEELYRVAKGRKLRDSGSDERKDSRSESESRSVDSELPTNEDNFSGLRTLGSPTRRGARGFAEIVAEASDRVNKRK